MLEKGLSSVDQFVGRSVPFIQTWGDLDLNYKVVAEIDQSKCIHCGLCYIACEDGAHQSIRWDQVPTDTFIAKNGASLALHHSGGIPVLPGAGGDAINVFTIKEHTCVGCNMCSLVCPVENCIRMKDVTNDKPVMSWSDYQRLLAEGKVQKIEPPDHV